MVSIKALEKKYYSLIPHQDFEALLSLALKKTKEYIFTHPEYSLSVSETLRFFYFLWMYRRGYSVAVLRGSKEFCGLEFYVTKHTLIPRPDTEIMVEAACEYINRLQQTTIILIDIGTGTGCIPISILKKCSDQKIIALATDSSAAALRTAQKNSQAHRVILTLLKGNLLTPFFNQHPDPKLLSEAAIVITANLPYLTQEQFESEPSIQREPKSALVANENGLALYRELLEQIKNNLLPLYKNKVTLYFEIDPSQSSLILSIIKKCLPSASSEIDKDFSGHNRLVTITLPTRS